MRIHFVLLLAAIFLLTTINAASNSSIKLRSSQNTFQSETTNGRVLQGDEKTEENIATDGEERNALTNAITKLGSKMNAWYKDLKLVTKLKLQSYAVYTDDFAQGLMKEGITPDHIYARMKLTKAKNRQSSTGENKPVYNLWLDYSNSYRAKYPQWQPQLEGEILTPHIWFRAPRKRNVAPEVWYTITKRVEGSNQQQFDALPPSKWYLNTRELVTTTRGVSVGAILRVELSLQVA